MVLIENPSVHKLCARCRYSKRMRMFFDTASLIYPTTLLALYFGGISKSICTRSPCTFFYNKHVCIPINDYRPYCCIKYCLIPETSTVLRYFGIQRCDTAFEKQRAPELLLPSLVLYPNRQAVKFLPPCPKRGLKICAF